MTDITSGSAFAKTNNKLKEIGYHWQVSRGGDGGAYLWEFSVYKAGNMLFRFTIRSWPGSCGMLVMSRYRMAAPVDDVPDEVFNIVGDGLNYWAYDDAGYHRICFSSSADEYQFADVTVPKMGFYEIEDFQFVSVRTNNLCRLWVKEVADEDAIEHAISVREKRATYTSSYLG